MKKKKVIIIGAGPGGLSAAMILASKGYEVEIFEKKDYIGGRNSKFSINGYTFDLGPTFLMMKNILEEIFEITGRDVSKYLDIKTVDPMYRLDFGENQIFYPSTNKELMKKEIEKFFPGNYKNYLKYMENEKIKYERLIPCLQIPYSNPSDFFKERFIKAIPYLDVHTNLFNHLGKYFTPDNLKLSFTFQAKYLGMSPWVCPGTFSIISYIEHSGGIHHTIGGLNQLSIAMAKAFEEEGGKIHLNNGVKQVIVNRNEAVGVKLESGENVYSDYIIINADFAHAMTNIMPQESLKKYTPEKLKNKKYSCSTFMLYLGVNKKYDISHHNIFFSSDYRQNVKEIGELYKLSEEPSIYVQNASITDPTLAPEGKSTIYVLVPIANNTSGINWENEKDRYKNKVLDILEKRAGLHDIRNHIEAEKIVTPDDWENNFYVYKGAVFNLAHGIDQMLYFRPHNEFEEIHNCYLVGGGTHPGSGLPTIWESGRISAGMILKRDAWYL